jgi:hypothetical protein
MFCWHVLLARQHPTVGLDHSPSTTADVVCDLGDLQTLRQTLQGVDAVVHVPMFSRSRTLDGCLPIAPGR